MDDLSYTKQPNNNYDATHNDAQNNDAQNNDAVNKTNSYDESDDESGHNPGPEPELHPAPGGAGSLCFTQVGSAFCNCLELFFRILLG